MEATLTASGRVIPAHETTLSSPVEARVLRILHRPGAELAAGEPIVELDTSEARLAVDRIQEQVEQKRAEQEEPRLQLEKELADLHRQTESQRLEVEILDYRLRQHEKLHEQGLTSEEAMRAADVEARQALRAGEK